MASATLWCETESTSHVISSMLAKYRLESTCNPISSACILAEQSVHLDHMVGFSVLYYTRLE